jgi:hypothetical protein
LQPSGAAQRPDEALRAVFVEGLSQKEAAQRFRYSPGAFRLLVGPFRAACAAGQATPFLPRNAGADRLANPRRRGRTSRRSPPPGP